MPDSDERYERVVLYSHWDGFIGESSHTETVEVMRCTACEALVLPGRQAGHDRWHESLTQRLGRAFFGIGGFPRSPRRTVDEDVI